MGLPRRRIALASSLVASLAAGACASSDEVTLSSSSPGGGTGTTTAGAGGAGGATTTTTTTTDTTSAGGAGGSITTGCASGDVCGDGACCAAGDECFDGACVPACASRVRCGDGGATCCDAAELCLGGACAVPTTKCLDYADCADDEVCEPTLGRCVPQAPGAPICEYRPPVGPLTPVLEWSWTGSSIKPTANQVINVPLVVDLENDGEPEVVIVTSADFTSSHSGYLRALRGKDGTEKWAADAGVYAAGNQVSPRGTPAAADLDGDGTVEIVSPRMGGGLVAFGADGSLRWKSTEKDGKTSWEPTLSSATVAIADVDGDGAPEVVVGGNVFDRNGRLIDDIVANPDFAGSHDLSYGAVSIVADVDGNGTQEIVTGNAAYELTLATLVPVWSNGETDGYPAIADLDLDGKPEVVVVSKGAVRVQDAASGAVLAKLAFPAGVGGAGGPPTVADFDGDGKPDFSTAGGKGYVVFTYTGGKTPKIAVLWQSVTQDGSSNRTGSSVFDFQGDGSAEVVYGDECFFRIYAGKDGEVLFETPSSSATIHEYPVIADIDADNRTEILVVANDYHHLGPDPTTTCPTYGAKDQPRHGVFAYGDQKNAWVRTRRVWNEHAFHVTNVGTDGRVPGPEPASWAPPLGLNNYRQSSQGKGVFDAPNLRVSLSADLAGCPGAVHLEARVQNTGSLGVAAGVDVTFHAGADAKGKVVASAKTTGALLPGQYEIVAVDAPLGAGAPPAAYHVVVDGTEGAPGAIAECLEDDNEASVAGVACPVAK